jgi:hypothetical protein
MNKLLGTLLLTLTTFMLTALTALLLAVAHHIHSL